MFRVYDVLFITGIIFLSSSGPAVPVRIFRFVVTEAPQRKKRKKDRPFWESPYGN